MWTTTFPWIWTKMDTLVRTMPLNFFLFHTFIAHNLMFAYCFPDFIDKLPLINSPNVFGLHPNAEIGYFSQAAKEMWKHLIQLQPQTGEPSFIFCLFFTFNLIIFYLISFRKSFIKMPL